jgi:hypothetical protein
MYMCHLQNKIKRIGGVMVRKLGSCAVDRGVRALVQSNQRSLYWYLLFLAKHVTLRSKSKQW